MQYRKYTLILTIIFKLEIINYYEILIVVISLFLIWFIYSKSKIQIRNNISIHIMYLC